MKNKGQKNQMISNQNIQHDIGKISTKAILYCCYEFKANLSWGSYKASKFWNIMCFSFKSLFKDFENFGHFNATSIVSHKTYYKGGSGDPPKFRHMGFKWVHGKVMTQLILNAWIASICALSYVCEFNLKNSS